MMHGQKKIKLQIWLWLSTNLTSDRKTKGCGDGGQVTPANNGNHTWCSTFVLVHCKPYRDCTTPLTFSYYTTIHHLFVQQTKHLTSSITLLSSGSAVSYYMLNAQLFLLPSYIPHTEHTVTMEFTHDTQLLFLPQHILHREQQLWLQWQTTNEGRKKGRNKPTNKLTNQSNSFIYTDN